MRTRLTFPLFCLIGLILFISCGKTEKAITDEDGVSTVLPEEENEVSVMRLEYTDFHHELIANGTVSSQNKADLKFQTQENVAAIYVKNGDKVSKGQKIAMLDQFKLQNTMAQANDNLERARLELQDVLIGQGYAVGDTAKVPKEVLKLAKVKSNYDQSEIQYGLAEYNLKNSVLYAPFDGVIANLFTKTHNIPNASEPFCTVVDNSRPEADFMILESELPVIRIGDKVQVSSFSISNYAAEGRVTEINPVIDKNGMVRIKAVISNPGSRLFEGMNIKIKLQRSLGKQLVIPKEALVLRTNKKVVFTYRDGMAMWVYVQTGLENSTGYVVTEGLAEGDSVIYEGNINLAHETPVIIK
ncbi:MAG: efflux RND transporter periplasmic adaptor subunit [Dysgonamonadaceae bacterium]|jgi:RND family efflux transporter MFP subunit|nr:efflux RND transporter periplasmic adaptor subunit [Dysgonamonadaceae bacterium]